MTTSTVGRPSVGWIATGMPRPLSTTRTPPSASRVTSTWSQYPASASSTELSTTSLTRWCRPRAPVEPMYMPGRLRTASSPSSTVIALASYPPLPSLVVFVVLDGGVLCSATGGGAPQALTRDGGRRPILSGSDHSMTLEFQAQARQE